MKYTKTEIYSLLEIIEYNQSNTKLSVDFKIYGIKCSFELANESYASALLEIGRVLDINWSDDFVTVKLEYEENSSNHLGEHVQKTGTEWVDLEDFDHTLTKEQVKSITVNALFGFNIKKPIRSDFEQYIDNVLKNKK